MTDKYIYYAKRCTCNRVYPLSVAQGFQSGDVVCDSETDTKAVMFWHYSGFAYISGEPDGEFLQTVLRDYILRERERRFVLITDDAEVIGFFSGMEGIAFDKRAEYRYDGDLSGPADPCGFGIGRITAENIGSIRGRITPAFSWPDEELFLKNGFGYVATDGDKIAAAAFSAAVSSDEVDIGVETAEEYRRRGLAKTLTSIMCRDIVSMGKRPVWAHSVSNIGSMRTALCCGFTQDRVNTVIRKVTIQNNGLKYEDRKQHP